MTHQNHQTNGASLEDCHTNFFALISAAAAVAGGRGRGHVMWVKITGVNSAQHLRAHTYPSPTPHRPAADNFLLYVFRHVIEFQRT
ncbi:Mediator of RNA polymerase II transcription subunit 13 [Papilio xuthus]|uniref:Mediator of RNA polymerase II transcription subunit 13 n=1 Tax=Papilio xuthus TaxID=66420 RepID=A0A194QNC3_PAPXU|nr:Mediator of RNA polymerase II transcription subunit 13 [Papilio xuthus]